MKFIQILRTSEKRFAELAEEFKVSLTVVENWAEGVVAPHPKLQRMVIAHLLNEKKINCNCDDHKDVSLCPYHQWFEEHK